MIANGNKDTLTTEFAWAASIAIVDSECECLRNISIEQLLEIRNIIKTEADAFIEDLLKQNGTKRINQ